MPDPAGQVFKPIIINNPPPLTLSPPSLSDFIPTSRLSRERLDKILSTIHKDFLSPRKINLLVEVLHSRESALTFDDSK